MPCGHQAVLGAGGWATNDPYESLLQDSEASEVRTSGLSTHLIKTQNTLLNGGVGFTVVANDRAFYEWRERADPVCDWLYNVTS